MTNHGLNLLTYYFLDEADRLVADEDADVTSSNSRFQFILTVWLIQACFKVLAHAPSTYASTYTHSASGSWRKPAQTSNLYAASLF